MSFAPENREPQSAYGKSLCAPEVPGWHLTDLLVEEVWCKIIAAASQAFTEMQAPVLRSRQPMFAFKVCPATFFHVNADDLCAAVRAGMTIAAFLASFLDPAADDCAADRRHLA